MARETSRSAPANRRKPAKASTPGWIWALVGLIPGLFIALMVYLGGYTAGGKRNVIAEAPNPAPSVESGSASEPRSAAESKSPAAEPVIKQKPVIDTREVRKQADSPLPPAPPASSPTSAAAKPRFDFYTILPEMEIAVPDKEISGKPEQGVAQVEKPGTYVLQAGSFKSFEEADHLKASLVLLGIEATIQTVTVNDKDTWHRVHIGPYKDLAELNQVRSRLKQNKIEAVLLKVKG